MVIAGETGDEHSDRTTANLEADRIANEGHHARYFHSVAEACSIVLHVNNNMNAGKKDGEDGEDVGETAAAKETEETSKKDVEIRRLIEERRSTPKEEKQRDQMHQKLYQRQKKIAKTTSHPKDSRRLQRCQSSTDVHINDTDDMTRIPEITTEELQDAINKLKKR